MQIERLDHLVLTVADVKAACAFYEAVLGMKTVTFAGNRKALVFPSGRIHLHPAGGEFEPKALRSTPGAADLCFVTRTPIAAVAEHLRAHSIPIVAGPVKRSGAFGPLLSVYVRDPDGNLVEIANEEDVCESP